MIIRNALLSTAIATALTGVPVNASESSRLVPARSEIPAQQHSMAFFVQRFQADLASTEHVYDISAGLAREAALRRLYQGWLARLAELSSESLSPEDRVDAALLQRDLQYRLQQLDFDRKRHDAALQLLPGIAPLIALAEQRRALRPLLPEHAKRLIVEASQALRDNELELRRKRGGHLFSKHRYLSAQIEAYLQDGLWLRLAAQANAMGQRLAQGIAGLNHAALTHPAQANMIFANWEPGGHARLQAAGAVYYDLRPLPDGRETARMVASWNTTEDHVDRFLGHLKA